MSMPFFFLFPPYKSSFSNIDNDLSKKKKKQFVNIGKVFVGQIIS